MPVTGTGTSTSGTQASHGYYYIGSQVQDYVAVTNTSGAPTNTTMACTIYLPDNTTSTPTPTNDSTGVYHISYTTTMAGLHTIRWVATGTVVGADEHTITVKKGATG